MEISTCSSDRQEELEVSPVFVPIAEDNKSCTTARAHEIYLKKREIPSELSGLFRESREDPKRFHVYFSMNLTFYIMRSISCSLTFSTEIRFK